jgi:hypothetical protein
MTFLMSRWNTIALLIVLAAVATALVLVFADPQAAFAAKRGP